MRTRLSISPLFSFLFLSITFSQGWQSVGPDSLSWQNVRRVSGKWFSPTSYRLAAATNNGISLSSNTLRTYPLVNVPGTEWTIGHSYFYWDFSPWEDSVYYAFADQYTEPSFHFAKRALAGGNWRAIGGGGCWITPLGMIFSPRDSTAFVTICGLHRSTNRGLTWSSLEGSNSNYNSKMLAFNQQSSNIVYKATSTYDQTALFVSTNSGSAWDSLFTLSIVYPNYLGESPFAVWAKENVVLAAVKSTIYDTSRAIGIYRSTDGGTSWSRVYGNGRVVAIVRSHINQNILFAASEEAILKSTDFGATWTMYNNALPTTRLTSLIISPYSDTMFVSTETHGVLKVWNFLTDVTKNEKLPERFELMQNYPNPFNPTTTIKFSVGIPSGQIPHSSFVILKVFDLLGREIATLVNEEMTPGSFERKFDGGGLASSMYFYRMQVGSFVQTRKLLLLR